MCSALCDVWSLGSVVAKGSRKPLTEDDLPEPSPIFALGAIEGTPAKIDARAAALRAADPDLKTPLVLKFVLAERRPLVVVACILGGCHGLINTCGRFIVLRLAIDAVLDESEAQRRHDRRERRDRRGRRGRRAGRGVTHRAAGGCARVHHAK